MEDTIKRYKNCMAMIFEKKYGIDNSIAKQWVIDYDFENIILETNYIALHDDPEEWVDVIYKYNNERNIS